MVSLNGYLAGGSANFLGFSRRGGIGWTEVSHLLPADGLIPVRARSCRREAVTTLVERSGMSRGYFYREFVLDHEQPYLIDANVGRPGGAGIIEQLAPAHGVEPAKILHPALVLGPPVPGPGIGPGIPAGLGVRIGHELPLRNGGRRRRGGTGSPTARETQPHEMAPAGSHVGPVGSGDRVWIGMLTGRTADALTGRTADEPAEIGHIEMQTTDGPRSPSYVIAS